MNWREWPKGEYTVFNNECPVCSSVLRSMEITYTCEPNYFNPEGTTFYTAICPKCRVQYFLTATAYSVHINPDAEYITDLEERVHILEETLSRLVVLSQQQPQKQQDTQTAQNDAQDFTRKYRYLL